MPLSPWGASLSCVAAELVFCIYSTLYILGFFEGWGNRGPTTDHYWEVQCKHSSHNPLPLCPAKIKDSDSLLLS